MHCQVYLLLEDSHGRTGMLSFAQGSGCGLSWSEEAELLPVTATLEGHYLDGTWLIGVGGSQTMQTDFAPARLRKSYAVCIFKSYLH